jgi:hypothetical protein
MSAARADGGPKGASSHLRVGLSLNLRERTLASRGPAVNRALVPAPTRRDVLADRSGLLHRE